MSYMSNRRMLVQYGSAKSDFNDVMLGVPQGSVLGPLLFMIFVNDLPNFITEGKVTMFADDTTITVSARSPDDLLAKVECISKQFKTWCERNKLILNMRKTVHLNFHIKKPLAEDFVNMAGITLADDGKFLGTWLDKNLSFGKHIDFVCGKLNSAFYAIFQMKYAMNEAGLLSMYYALVYSHLNNNIISWGVSKFLNRVFLQQKRILRLIFNLKPRVSCRPFFKEKHLLTVFSIFILKCVLYIKKNQAIFTNLSDTVSYNIRNQHTLTIPTHKTSFFKRSPDYNCIKMYNNLPLQLRQIDNLHKFKTKTKEYLVSMAFYSFDEYLDR